jgi:H/ACA ribonucleoprotein complex subunit 4
MLELRRTRAGPFHESEGLVTLYDVLFYGENWRKADDEQIIRRLIYPMEKALEFLPKIHVRDSAVSAICHGAYVTAPGVLSVATGIRKTDELVVSTQKGEAVAFAKAAASTEQILEKDHGMVAETSRVLMNRDTYPKMWRAHNQT